MHIKPFGQAWALTGKTGTMAASLGANSVVFAMGALAADASRPNILPPGPLKIEAFRMTFSVVLASATPAVVGRCLQLFKATDNAQPMPTGGSSLTARPKRTMDAGANSGMIGDAAVISSTAALTVTGFTRDTVPLVTFDLCAEGGSGARATFDYFEDLDSGPLWLDPGEILVVSNPAAFDAVMTWQLSVNVGYRRRDTGGGSL